MATRAGAASHGRLEEAWLDVFLRSKIRRTKQLCRRSSTDKLAESFKALASGASP